MPAAPVPADEKERIAALRSYEILDTEAETVFDNLARFAARLTDSPVALISLVDADRQWFKAKVGIETSGTPREASLCAHAILQPDQPLIVEDAASDPRFADSPLVTGEPGFRFYAGMPLRNPQGHALGTLCVVDHRPRTMDRDQREAIERLAETVTTALELRRAMNQARHLAMTDSLTGIANRPAFLERLDRALDRMRRHDEPFSLLYLDLDGFKRVNDVHGHATGDRLLRRVAETLTALIGPEDLAARIGGDEFAVLLAGAGRKAGAGTGAAPVAERLRAGIKARMDEAGWPVTASIGAVDFRDLPDDAGEIVAAGDELMYAAKAAGKNQAVHRIYRRGPSRVA